MAKTELGEKDLLNPNETILLFDLSSRKFLLLSEAVQNLIS